MSDYEIECGRRFREERVALGLTQADVHRATGIAKHTIVAYESGASNLFIRHKATLEELGFDLQYIYFGDQISPRFNLGGMFDTMLQVILHMQKKDRGVDRDVALQILEAVYTSPSSKETYESKTAKALLSLVASEG